MLAHACHHADLARLVGIRQIVLAVNKMDLVGHDQAASDAIVDEFRRFGTPIGIDQFVAVRLSGLTGANVADPSPAMPWYSGPTRLGHLETVKVEEDAGLSRPFRLPVQCIDRPELDLRGFAGLIAPGRVAVGDPVRIVPSGHTTTVAGIVGPDGEWTEAVGGVWVTLALADEVDCSRGEWRRWG